MNAKFLWIVSLFLLCKWITVTSENRVPQHFWGSIGNGHAGFIEPNAPSFSGEEQERMITGVCVVQFKYSGRKYIKCFDFFYGYGDHKYPATGKEGEEVDKVPFDKDEYVIEIRGHRRLNIITQLVLVTNKRTIGPYGYVGSHSERFTVKHNGAPLLYANITCGALLYEMSFTFHKYGVRKLKGLAEQVAGEVYQTLTSNINDMDKVQTNYKRMVYDVAMKGCYIYKEKQYSDAVSACNLKAILEQINILIMSRNVYTEHLPRNIVRMKQYDSREFLKQVDKAKDFHNLLTELKFDLQKVIDVTEEQSLQLRQYFNAQAEFDMKISQTDIEGLQGDIKRMKKGASDASNLVGNRLRRIIGAALGVTGAALAERIATLAVLIATNSNPFKLIFTGPDVLDIRDATEDIAQATENVSYMIRLQVQLDKFLKLLAQIGKGFAANAQQMASLETLVNSFDANHTTDVIKQMSLEFVETYGEYTPAVEFPDIVYVSEILATVSDDACAVMSESSGISGNIINTIYQAVTDDCLYISADLATLHSYFEETYSLQFELVDSLRKLVRASVASHMASNIGKIDKKIDIETAALGSTMVEIQFQTAAHTRCNVLEYVEGGKRPDVCKNIIFSQTDIDRLISYTGSSHVSFRDSFAYIPTSIQQGVQTPYINLTKLVQDNQVTVLLPMNDADWLKRYNWLPGHFNPETAFYIQLIEPYIPDLKCLETGKRASIVYTELTSGKPQYLYKQPSEATYTIYQHLVKFSYTTMTDQCPGAIEEYPVKNESSGAEASVAVCVTSRGNVGEGTCTARDDYAFPSLYSSWTLKVQGGKGCTLMLDPQLTYSPFITFKLRIIEVIIKAHPSDEGIDECWPEGSRCQPGYSCVDETLGYSCEMIKGSILN